MVFIPIQNINLETKVNVWEYILSGGYRVLAGKTDKDNDLLSLELADPDDWWFHICRRPGSHVILKIESDNALNFETLYQSAAIAAYHSKARGNGIVAVSGTLAKYVIKPRGSKPGTVSIRKERIFKVKPCVPSN